MGTLKKLDIFAIIALTLLFAQLVSANTYSVGHGSGYDFSSITAALQTVISGDVIEVADGNYTAATGEVFPISIKEGVKIQRENQSELPHIIGDQTSSVFSAIGFSDYNTTLNGLWISGGVGYLASIDGVNWHQYGGGIFCRDVNMTIINCNISNNTATGGGGGMACSNSNPIIETCDLENNYVDGKGGGLYCFTSGPEINNCSFQNNLATNGGICLTGEANSNPVVRNCTFTWTTNYRANYYDVSGVEFLDCYNAEIIESTIHSVDGGPGLYFSNSSSLVLRCNISAQQGHSGVGISALANSFLSISDCQILNGGASAVRIQNSTATIQDCDVIGNGCGGGKGVIYSASSEINVINCNISENDCSGIELSGNQMSHIYQSVIRGNDGPYGAGVRGNSVTGEVVISDCKFFMNSGYSTIEFSGFSGNKLSLNRCSIYNNIGVGIKGYSGDFDINQCMIYDNANIQSTNYGGGIFLSSYSDMTVSMIKNSAIFNNSASLGGGIYLSDYRGTIGLTNCTIYGNTATQFGGGIYCESSNPILTNCILWDNSVQEIYIASGAPTLNYCDIERGWTGPGSNNINSDPLFVNASQGDFHLTSDSPCIDTGTAVGAPNIDFDSEARPNPNTGVVDIGADEYYSDYVTNTPTNTPTFTNTPTPTATETPSDTPTNTITPFPTSTATPTRTPCPTQRPCLITYSRTMSIGWNLFGINQIPLNVTDAQSLSQSLLNYGVGVTHIANWNGSSWNIYQYGLPFNNFAILPQQGYMIRCSQGGNWTYQVDVCN